MREKDSVDIQLLPFISHKDSTGKIDLDNESKEARKGGLSGQSGHISLSKHTAIYFLWSGAKKKINSMSMAKFENL